MIRRLLRRLFASDMSRLGRAVARDDAFWNSLVAGRAR